MFKILTDPQFLAAFRNVLSALAATLATLGLASWLPPETVAKIMELVQQLGLMITAVATLAAIVVPPINAWVASCKANPINQVKAAAAAANDPTTTPAKADEIKQTLISTTEQLPEVKRVVTN